MKRKLLVIQISFLIIFIFTAFTFAESRLPRKKQTTLGLYVTAKQAFAKWHASTEKVAILDVRTPEEYIFVGHAPMARNIPVKLFTAEQTAQKRKPVMELNPDFISEVKKHYKVTDTILVMCRSGGRSAVAANLLAKEGFNNAYSITDGFEGDKVKDPQSYYHGKRVKNGWKNSGAPWTYKLDLELMYHR